MQTSAVVLATAATATTSPKNFDSGGRAALVLSASAYGTTVKLQILGPDGTTYIALNATTYSADGVYPLDCPAGQYRIFISGGTTTALNATLVRIPY